MVRPVEFQRSMTRQFLETTCSSLPRRKPLLNGPAHRALRSQVVSALTPTFHNDRCCRVVYLPHRRGKESVPVWRHLAMALAVVCGSASQAVCLPKAWTAEDSKPALVDALLSRGAEYYRNHQ